MSVRKRVGKLAMALVIVLVAGSSLHAKDAQTMTLMSPAMLGSTKFDPGSYKVTWQAGASDSTVTFKQGRKVVATAPGKWVKRDAKYSNGGVVYSENPDGSHSIQEIRFAGSDQVLVFGDSGAGTESTVGGH
ncbi:MAG: hypothetical protein ACLQOO_02410 [Terriglobia bacterium]